MRQRTCPGGTNTTCIHTTKTSVSNKRTTAKKKVLIKMSDSQVLFRLLFVVVVVVVVADIVECSTPGCLVKYDRC
jgi:hypothetical protein